MLRIVNGAICAGIARAVTANTASFAPFKPVSIDKQVRCLSTLLSQFHFQPDVRRNIQCGSLPSQSSTGKILLSIPQPVETQARTITKFSLSKGKRRTVKAVIKRFYRLNWGIWIRTRSGRFSKAWKKSGSRRRRLREHVFVNAKQSTLLDKMVTRYWRRPRFYVDDPYNPYHNRPQFFITRNKPHSYT